MKGLQNMIKYPYEIMLGLACIIFIALKYTVVSLPLFWDEILYGCAIQSMMNEPLTFSPTSIPVDLSRGHPIFYHFFNSLMYKISFGSGISSLKIIALLTATFTSLSLFYTTSKLGISKRTSLIASTLLLLQGIFYVQSTFLLPEILLTLLSIWCLYFFLTKKHILLFICTTCMLFTKETGIVLWIAMLLTAVIHKPFRNIKIGFSLLIPLGLLVLYFYWQYIEHGWVFFPYHTHLLNFSFSYIIKILEAELNILFVKQHRLLYFIPIPFIVYHYYKNKPKVNLFKNVKLHLILLFFLGYLFFCSFNFFTDRYLLAIFPIITLLAASVFNAVFTKKKEIAIAFLFVCMLMQSKKIILHDKTSDVNMGYADAIYVAQQPIEYLQTISNISKDTICTHFLMRQMITMPCAGYVKENETFSHAIHKLHEPHQYVVISSYDPGPGLETVTDNPDYELLKEFKKNKAWSAIYGKKKN